MDLCVATTATDSFLAAILRDVLEAEGIEVSLADGGLSNVVPGTSAATIQVLVRESDLDRALAILAEYEAAGLEADADEEA